MMHTSAEPAPFASRLSTLNGGAWNTGGNVPTCIPAYISPYVNHYVSRPAFPSAQNHVDSPIQAPTAFSVVERLKQRLSGLFAGSGDPGANTHRMCPMFMEAVASTRARFRRQRLRQIRSQQKRSQGAIPRRTMRRFSAPTLSARSAKHQPDTPRVKPHHVTGSS